MSLIHINCGTVPAQTKLRDKPSSTKLVENDVQQIVKENNFYDSKLNINGSFKNDFVDNGDGTITDNATGLMWEQKGFKREVDFSSAEKYVKKLNKKKFGGYNNWRMPTIEELYSLLDSNLNGDLHINSAFEAKAFHCWSCDKSGLPSLMATKRRGQYLTLDYKKGTFSDAHTGKQPGGSSANNFSSYIRAVRSID